MVRVLTPGQEHIPGPVMKQGSSQFDSLTHPMQMMAGSRSLSPAGVAAASERKKAMPMVSTFMLIDDAEKSLDVLVWFE